MNHDNFFLYQVLAKVFDLLTMGQEELEKNSVKVLVEIHHENNLL